MTLIEGDLVDPQLECAMLRAELRALSAELEELRALNAIKDAMPAHWFEGAGLDFSGASA